MNDKLFEEQLQENYLVKEAILHLKSFDLDFLINQAKEKGYFSYEILVGVVDYLTEHKELIELVEYHHVVFVKEVLNKMISGTLDNWPAPELRRHYLRELDTRLTMMSTEMFQLEIDLEKKRELFKNKEITVGISLDGFEKELNKNDNE